MAEPLAIGRAIGYSGQDFYHTGSCAVLFLIYTLFNLERLGISPTHPRVIVEASLVIGFVVAGLIILN